MKRLKYTCLFGGKEYPRFIVLTIFVIVPIFTVMHEDWSFVSAYALTIFCDFAALLVCYYIEQRLTPEERELIDESSPPLWVPASQNVCEVAADLARYPGHFVYVALVVCGGFALAGAFPKHGEPNYTLVKMMAILFAAVFLIDFIRRMIWKTIDETAVYAVISIDHMYDTTIHVRGGSYEKSYLVFYQPDGRYVLRAKHGTGDCDSIAVIKYRGMVTWVPYFFDPSKFEEDNQSII